MRHADPDLRLIAWADTHRHTGEEWASVMREVDGIDLLAFHHHFDSGLPDSPLFGTDYRLDFEKTWIHLMHAHHSLQTHIDRLRAVCNGKHLAMTEGHFTLPGRNRNEVLSTWAAGVAYARCHNVLMRNSDLLDIATLADFFGNVWQCNAVMLPTPLSNRGNHPYLQPVAAVMALFGRHQGKFALTLSCDADVDAVASRTGNTVYLHLVNTDMHSARQLKLDVGRPIAGIKAEIIAADPQTEITMVNPDVFTSRTLQLTGDTLTLPPAAVAAVEISLPQSLKGQL